MVILCVFSMGPSRIQWFVHFHDKVVQTSFNKTSHLHSLSFHRLGRDTSSLFSLYLLFIYCFNIINSYIVVVVICLLCLWNACNSSTTRLFSTSNPTRPSSVCEGRRTIKDDWDEVKGIYLSDCICRALILMNISSSPHRLPDATARTATRDCNSVLILKGIHSFLFIYHLH